MPGYVCTEACPEASADRWLSVTILAVFQSVPRVLSRHIQQKPYTQIVSFSQAEFGYRHALEKDRESNKGTNVLRGEETERIHP